MVHQESPYTKMVITITTDQANTGVSPAYTHSVWMVPLYKTDERYKKQVALLRRELNTRGVVNPTIICKNDIPRERYAE